MSTDITNSADTIDVRDIIARVEELREERDGFTLETEDGEEQSSKGWAEDNADDAEELSTFEALLEDLKGNGGDEQWEGDWYPVTLIRDSYFTEAMQELCEDIGDLPKGVENYMVIDWEATAKNLQMDYTSTEYDGVTYWYR